MIKRWLSAGLIGGIVMFLWSSVSWMMLSWHEQTLASFADEEMVATVLARQAPQRGVYLLPNAWSGDDTDPRAQAQAEAAAAVRMQQGPVVFAAISPGGVRPMPIAMGLAFFTDLIGAWLIATLLLPLAHAGFGRRAAGALLIALFGGLAAHLPYWIWWGFEPGYIGVTIADFFIGWSLAGLAVAAILKGNAHAVRA